MDRDRPGAGRGDVDPTGHLTIAEVVRAREFVPTQGDLIAGYRFEPYWLRFTLHRPPGTPGGWWLEVQPNHFDEVSLFVSNGAGGFDERAAGDTLPFAAREVPYRTPVFRLQLAEEQNLTGERLAAITILQMFPETEALTWLAECLDPDLERLFIGYQASVALLQAVRSLPANDCRALREVIDTAMSLAKRNADDKPRLEVLETAREELQRKCAAAEGA